MRIHGGLVNGEVKSDIGVTSGGGYVSIRFKRTRGSKWHSIDLNTRGGLFILNELLRWIESNKDHTDVKPELENSPYDISLTQKVITVLKDQP